MRTSSRAGQATLNRSKSAASGGSGSSGGSPISRLRDALLITFSYTMITASRHHHDARLAGEGLGSGRNGDVTRTSNVNAHEDGSCRTNLDVALADDDRRNRAHRIGGEAAAADAVDLRGCDLAGVAPDGDAGLSVDGNDGSTQRRSVDVDRALSGDRDCRELRLVGIDGHAALGRDRCGAVGDARGIDADAGLGRDRAGRDHALGGGDADRGRGRDRGGAFLPPLLDCVDEEGADAADRDRGELAYAGGDADCAQSSNRHRRNLGQDAAGTNRALRGRRHRRRAYTAGGSTDRADANDRGGCGLRFTPRAEDVADAGDADGSELELRGRDADRALAVDRCYGWCAAPRVDRDVAQDADRD